MSDQTAALGDRRGEQVYDEQAIAIAFLAGWMSSGEGWNGEDPGMLGQPSPTGETVIQRVLQAFDMWMLEVSMSSTIGDDRDA
jgi:hypothetical protein